MSEEQYSPLRFSVYSIQNYSKSIKEREKKTYNYLVGLGGSGGLDETCETGPTAMTAASTQTATNVDNLTRSYSREPVVFQTLCHRYAKNKSATGLQKQQTKIFLFYNFHFKSVNYFIFYYIKKFNGYRKQGLTFKYSV